MEPTRQNNVIDAIKEARKLFNQTRSNLSSEETKRIRKKFYKKEVVYNILKEQEQQGSLTNKEKKVLKNIGRFPKNISTHLKNLKKHFKKLQIYQYGLDYLFNEHNEEEYTSNNDIKAIKDARKLLNELRSNLSHEEINRIRKILYKKEVVYNILKEQEQEGCLTNNEKKVLKNIGRYPKNIAKHLKNLKKHFKKLQKYQYGLDYLFNEHNEENYNSNNDINAFKKVRNLLNELRSNFLRKENNEIRKKIYKKETVYNSLKEKDSLTNEEKKALKKIDRYLKNFKKDLEKLQKYQYNITHGLDHLFNEEDDYYKPREVKSAFDGSYVLYESKGNKDNDIRLALYEYFDIITPYLRDMIDDHKAKMNGKYNYQCESFLFLLQMQMKLVICIQKVIM